MGSPPPLNHFELAGASHTHDGVFRGHAYGNQMNMADLKTADGEVLYLPAKVRLYVTPNSNSVSWNISTMSCQVVKLRKTSSLQEVLIAIADKNSPICSKSLIYSIKHVSSSSI